MCHRQQGEHHNLLPRVFISSRILIHRKRYLSWVEKTVHSFSNFTSSISAKRLVLNSAIWLVKCKATNTRIEIWSILALCCVPRTQPVHKMTQGRNATQCEPSVSHCEPACIAYCTCSNYSKGISNYFIPSSFIEHIVCEIYPVILFNRTRWDVDVCIVRHLKLRWPNGCSTGLISIVANICCFVGLTHLKQTVKFTL